MKRKRLSKKEKKILENQLKNYIEINLKKYEIDEISKIEELMDYNKIYFWLDKGQALAFETKNYEIFPTLYVINEFRNKIPKITVDHGAMIAILKGANLMIPGIVKIEGTFAKNELVAININDIIIAIGHALSDSEKLTKKHQKQEKGLAIKIIHHVNDKIWKFKP